jgi:hypothetical protein
LLLKSTAHVFKHHGSTAALLQYCPVGSLFLLARSVHERRIYRYLPDDPIIPSTSTNGHMGGTTKQDETELREGKRKSFLRFYSNVVHSPTHPLRAKTDRG